VPLRVDAPNLRQRHVHQGASAAPPAQAQAQAQAVDIRCEGCDGLFKYYDVLDMLSDTRCSLYLNSCT
jgi:hypothetical protein